MKTKLHPNLKLVLIGLYIGLISSAATPIMTMLIVYMPIVTVPPPPIVNVICIATTFVFEEIVRKSRLQRRTKVIIFAVTAALAALAYVAFLAWAFRWFTWL